ncbi:hypothetical protein ACFPRL_32065 [Pseudoclavibacter helvolus]
MRAGSVADAFGTEYQRLRRRGLRIPRTTTSRDASMTTGTSTLRVDVISASSTLNTPDAPVSTVTPLVTPDMTGAEPRT